jgi:hypothetical protein
MKKTRTLLAAAAATVGLVAFAGQAQAAPPDKTVRPSPIDVTLVGQDTAGVNGFCAFPVHIVGTSNQLIHEGSNGNQATGFISVTVTNETTGKTLKFNISGPGTVTGPGNGTFQIDAKGPNLLWTTVANSFPGVPQLAYTTGHVQVTVVDNLTTEYHLSGNSTDVCELLK